MRAAVAEPTEAPPRLPRQEPHEGQRRQHHRQAVQHPVALRRPPYGSPRNCSAARRCVGLRRHRQRHPAVREQRPHLRHRARTPGKGGGRWVHARVWVGGGCGSGGGIARRSICSVAEPVRIRFRWLVGGGEGGNQKARKRTGKRRNGRRNAKTLWLCGGLGV